MILPEQTSETIETDKEDKNSTSSVNQEKTTETPETKSNSKLENKINQLRETLSNSPTHSNIDVDKSSLNSSKDEIDESPEKPKVSLKDLAKAKVTSMNRCVNAVPSPVGNLSSVEPNSPFTPNPESMTDEDEIPGLEDAPPVPIDRPETPKKSPVRAVTPTIVSEPSQTSPESFLKSPVKKNIDAEPGSKQEPKPSKPGAKIEEIFAKLDEKKMVEEKKKKFTSGPSKDTPGLLDHNVKTETPAQDAILSKILGKPIRDDPLVLGPDEPDLDLGFDTVPVPDMEVGSEVVFLSSIIIPTFLICQN